MNEIHQVVDVLKRGGVGCMATDTIFGLVASVRFPAAIERIYELKGRPKTKKLIHLISDLDQLTELGVYPNETQLSVLSEIWPAPKSVILPTKDNKVYENDIAVRMPEPLWLREIVREVGPVVATSANLSGQPTPTDMTEIRRIFPALDFYLDGPSATQPSRLFKFDGDRLVEIERTK